MIENYKKDGDGSKIIATITCSDISEVEYTDPVTGEKGKAYDFCLDEKFFIPKPEVEGGDVINVRTIMDLDIPVRDCEKFPFRDGDPHEFVFSTPFPYFYSLFFISFLIELDPL